MTRAAIVPRNQIYDSLTHCALVPPKSLLERGGKNSFSGKSAYAAYLRKTRGRHPDGFQPDRDVMGSNVCLLAVEHAQLHQE